MFTQLSELFEFMEWNKGVIKAYEKYLKKTSVIAMMISTLNNINFVKFRVVSNVYRYKFQCIKFILLCNVICFHDTSNRDF